MYNAKRMARVGVLAALAALLYLIPGIPVIPPIYKLDFSTVPVLVAGLISGPIDALIVLLIKDLTGLLHSSSMGVGELADFLCSAAMVLSAWWLFKKKLPGLPVAVLSTLAMGLMGAVINYFIMIPFYVKVMSFPLDKIISLVSATVAWVKDLPSLIAFATVPFNLLKGAVICALAYPIYRAIKKYIR